MTRRHSTPPLALALCLLPLAARAEAAEPDALAMPLAAPAPAAQSTPPDSAPAVAAPAVAPAPDVALPPASDTAPAVEQPRHSHHAKGDSLEGFNRKMFSFQWKLDKAAIRPLSMGVKQVLPKPARSGISNFFGNINEVIVFLNDLLQLRPGRAVRTLARFTINSTVGIGGLVDVAKKEGLPHRPNGLGTTLARYGVGSGPYLFLPLVGPTNLRDLLGGQGDYLVLPLSIGKPFGQLKYEAPKAVVSGAIERIDNDDEIKALFRDTIDPYAAMRSAYQQNRTAELRLNQSSGPGIEDQSIPFEDDLVDPGASSAPAGESGTAPAVNQPQADQAPVPDTTSMPTGSDDMPAPNDQPAPQPGKPAQPASH